MTKIWWGDFTASEFQLIDPLGTIAVLPVAAIEQHGPHLPLITDTAIMQALLETAIPLIPADLDVRILPIQAVGKSDEHLYAPGTLTLPPAALIDCWTELGASVFRAGIRKLVIVTSHGGNEEIIGIVARELRISLGMLAVKTAWQRFGRPTGLYSDLEERHGVHGGDVETSLMLHFRPDLVDMSKAENFMSSVAQAEQEFTHLRPTGPHGFGWIASDLNPAGAVGDAAAATAEKGKLTAEHQARGFVELLQDVNRAKLTDWLS